ncbi:hypothetical protein CAP40_05730 [Sphingomonas sp. IBVSS2]|uniref:hypothetical protein n=1 Tax=Sphingomonas sp. IBVSS2 TaxID=1985172 RepID=UPI000A2D9EF0|nr:hypothetical protein [Sphingomonas sp. IBVSS2]OSZ70313.1 hypothetical protein CAP40_05730 [Sphingomonas sp. IBVSS2]
MRPSFLLGSALCVLAVLTAVDARAQCAARLERANHNARDMPENTPSEVHDQLSDQSLLADETKDSNPAECLKAVVRMEALMRRHGKAIVEESGMPAAVAAARPRTLDELFPPTPLSRRLAQMRVPTGGQTRADALALNEYANASRALGFAIYSGTIESNAAAAAEAVSVTDRAVAAAEATQETMIMINQEGDMLHAQLEDAFRELETAQRAQDRFAQKYGELAPLSQDPVANPLKRLEAAKRNLKNATDRLNKWIERNLEEGFAPGYLGAMRVLEARYKPKFEKIEEQCEKMRQAAFDKFAQAALTGKKTTALEDAGKACSQMEKPLKEQSQREEDEIHKKYKLPEKPDDDLLAPLTPEPKGAGKEAAPAKAPEASDDDLLAPLTPEPKGAGKEAAPAKAPEASDDDLLAPLTPQPKGAGKEAAPAKAPEAPADDLLAPLTPQPRGAGKGPGSGKPK